MSNTIAREPIFVALFAKLAVIAGLKTKSRTLRHWSDVSKDEQPALFLAARGGPVDPRPAGLPWRRELMADIYLYVNSSNKSIAPSTLLNDFLDKIEASLEPTWNGDGKQTLGGLCEHVWIEGVIETDEGTLGDQAVAIVPVKILVVGN